MLTFILNARFKICNEQFRCPREWCGNQHVQCLRAGRHSRHYDPIQYDEPKSMKTPTLITVYLLIALPTFSQTHVVKGKITTFNRYPVQNVEVASKKAKTAVMTDSLGQFELVCNVKDVIMIKSKVFVSFNKRVTPDDNYITANLIFKDTKKNREIAAGLGYIKPEQLSYALAHLSDENNNFCNFPDVFTLLMTYFPEVQVMSGSSGAAEGLYIRGQKSINPEMKNEAVYEVDGMIVGDISFVNPCEIATINILRSGGTAVYGTQAVNGVVIIQTKANRIHTHD